MYLNLRVESESMNVCERETSDCDVNCDMTASSFLSVSPFVPLYMSLSP